MINRIFNAACDTLMAPFRALNPWVGLCVFSLVITVIALFVFKFCSSQRAIAHARNQLLAHVLELRLFKDDLPGIFSTLGRVLIGTLAYLKHYMVPIAILLIPVSLVLIQMSCWFDYRPFRPGESGLLTVTLRPDFKVMDLPLSVSSSNIDVEPEPLRIPSENRIIWRFHVRTDASDPITVTGASEPVGVLVRVGTRLEKISDRRVGAGIFAGLLNPAERPFDKNSIFAEMEINYPARSLGMNWLAACFVLTIVFALALKPIFRVEL